MDYNLRTLYLYKDKRETPILTIFENLRKGMIVFPNRNVTDGRHFESCKEFREQGSMEVVVKGSGAVISKRGDGTKTNPLHYGDRKNFLVYDISEEVWEEREKQRKFDEEYESYS